ncbi:MAG TPA: site-specific DNA-methyltransferase [Ignavibacteriaceae bacterium]|nr:site-specific DNA-methyltransferase [Ignavibacteriaceae bacterium]
MTIKKKATNNRTITLNSSDFSKFGKLLIKLNNKASADEIQNKVINQDLFKTFDFLPESFVDLLIIDPPYNLSKNYNGNKFHKMSHDGYYKWVESWLVPLKKTLKPSSSIYICGDWRTSFILSRICDQHFILLNRITFAREKGRGSKKSWKNNSEDIWFCANSKNYYFNYKGVKIKRRVIAPYSIDGKPKDWKSDGKTKYRFTYASNIWDDITMPFWSMSENTPHPTQKPEKLLAKIILASSKEGDVVFDPFSGVGSTGVVAKKLNRNFVMIELDKEYCLYSLKRLELADSNNRIQGFKDGVFLERNYIK